MQYRLYNPEDFAAVYAIEEACFHPPLRFSRSYMLRLVQQRNGATWIAEDSGVLCGFAIVGWTREGIRLIAYIQTIEVLGEWRGRGVGRELLRRTEASARGVESAFVWLHVDAVNGAAIRLYHSQGYVMHGRAEGYYGRGRAAVIYAKPLPVADGS